MGSARSGLLGILSLVAIAYVVFRPLAAPRSLPDPDVRRSAAELVRRHGTDTLSYFKLRRDTHYIFSPDRQAFVGYRIENGVLLVSGDPVGPDDALQVLTREVCRYSEQHGLELAAMGASERMLPLWREAGLRTLYVGDEAIVDTKAFSLEGRSIRKVRRSVSRLEAAGFDSALVTVADLDDETAPNSRTCRACGGRAQPSGASRWRWMPYAARNGGTGAWCSRGTVRAGSAASSTSCRPMADRPCPFRPCGAIARRRTG